MIKIIFSILVYATFLGIGSCKKEPFSNDAVVILPPPTSVPPPTLVTGCSLSLTPLGNLSIARPSIQAVTVGNKILFTGGYLFTSPPCPCYGIPQSSVDIYDASANQWSTAELSVKRDGIAVAAIGNKVLFAGGNTFTGPGTSVSQSRVDIYDASANQWSTAELSMARSRLSVGVSSNKIFFAGGSSSRVDVYDVSANRWAVAELSKARSNLSITTLENKVFFSGGDYYNGDASDVVDIYDISANTWSTTQLSEGKYAHSATVVNNKIYFAGGYTGIYDSLTISKRVDIYDGLTTSWSTGTMSEPTAEMASIVAGNFIFWVGGYTNNQASAKVEMFDVATGNSKFHQLPEASAFFKIAKINNKILFYAGDYSRKVDVYDLNSNTWNACQLSPSLKGPAIISSGNKVYVAGGDINGVLSNQVWLLDF